MFFLLYISDHFLIELLTEFCPPRARPVINIKKEIRFSPKEIDLTKKNCKNRFWYVCLSFLLNMNKKGAKRSSL